MAEELQPTEEHEKEIPRWAQIPLGLALGFMTLALGLATAKGLLFTPNERAPILAIVVGLVFLFVCAWLLEKCFRLITGRKNRGGLMSPATLRVISVFFLVFPVVGLFTGYYRQMGAVAILQAVMDFFAFLGLRGLASRREAQTASNDLQKKQSAGGATQDSL